jgi:hypothetical protein
MTGAVSVAVGGGGTIGGIGVFDGITGIEVGDKSGARVRVGGKGVCVSVGCDLCKGQGWCK